MNVKFNSVKAVDPNFKGFHKVDKKGTAPRIQAEIRRIAEEEFGVSIPASDALYVVCTSFHDGPLAARFHRLGVRFFSNTAKQPKSIAPDDLRLPVGQLQAYFA